MDSKPSEIQSAHDSPKLSSSDARSSDLGAKPSSSKSSATIAEEAEGRIRADEKAGLEKEKPRDVEKAQPGDAAREPETTEGGFKIVNWDGDEDPDCPLNMSLAKKWWIVFIVSMGSICVTCCSSMISLTYEGVMQDFSISREVATLGLSLFIGGLGLGPLFLGPLSEFYGRGVIYTGSFIFFFAFQFPVAFAPGLASWLVGRFLTGVAGSAFLSVAGGSVSDVFRPHEVSVPMSTYGSSPFFGPVLGPIIAGFINYNTTWRWTWYLQIIWAGILLVAFAFFVPETHAPTLLKRRAQRLRARGQPGDDMWRAKNELNQKSIPKTIAMSCVIPFKLLALEPVALLLNIWTALLLGILYMFFSAFPIVFKQHNFNLQEQGLSFLGIGIGITISVFWAPWWAKDLERYAARHTNGGPVPPEAHLRKGMAGGVLVPIGMFWFAGASGANTPWPIPVVGSIPFGMGMVLVYQSVFTFLVAAFRPYAASAMASNSFMRSSFAAAFPLFSVQMYNTLRPIGASMLCAGLTLLMTPLPFLFYKYGEKLRKRSQFSDAR